MDEDVYCGMCDNMAAEKEKKEEFPLCNACLMVVVNEIDYPDIFTNNSIGIHGIQNPNPIDIPDVNPIDIPDVNPIDIPGVNPNDNPVGIGRILQNLNPIDISGLNENDNPVGISGLNQNNNNPIGNPNLSNTYRINNVPDQHYPRWSRECGIIQKCQEAVRGSICRKMVREGNYIVFYWENSNLLVSHICV